MSELSHIMSLKCGCDFTSDRLTDSVFLCSSSSPNSVTYQAQLHGTLQANVSRLVWLFEEEVSHRIIEIKVLFSLLRIEKFCTVPAGTKVPCKEESTGQDICGIVGGAVAAIIIVMVLISIATLSVLGFFFMVSKRKSSKTPEESKPQ